MAELDPIEIRRKRAFFRAQRRGFKELDLIFAAFAEAHLPTLVEPDLTHFEALLSIPDWQIYAWIMGHEPVPDAYDDPVFSRLCAYRPQFVS